MKETPLHIASKIGNEKLIAALLNKGADAKAKDSYGRTCIETAKYHKQTKAMQLLLSWNILGKIPPNLLEA